MTTNGKNPMRWEMGLGFDYTSKRDEHGKEYYVRYPNHIAPMKKELIKDYKFLPINRGEDYQWATQLRNDGVFKTEKRITEKIYHYQFKK